MTMSHNQMAYVAIVSTLIFGSLFVGATGYFQTSEGIGGYQSEYEDDLVEMVSTQMVPERLTEMV